MKMTLPMHLLLLRKGCQFDQCPIWQPPEEEGVHQPTSNQVHIKTCMYVHVTLVFEPLEQ